MSERKDTAFGCSRRRCSGTGCFSCNPEKTAKWLAKKEAAEAAEAATAAEETRSKPEAHWEEVEDAEACFEEVPEEMMDPELEGSFQGEDGDLEPEAEGLLEAAFAKWKP